MCIRDRSTYNFEDADVDFLFTCFEQYENCLLYTSGGDNAAGAVGVGMVDANQAMLSLGTSGVYFAVSEGFLDVYKRQR